MLRDRTSHGNLCLQQVVEAGGFVDVKKREIVRLLV